MSFRHIDDNVEEGEDYDISVVQVIADMVTGDLFIMLSWDF